MTVGSRSIRMMAILFVFNSILAAVALFNMYSVAEQVRTTAEIQYSQFLDLYTFVSSIEFIMLLFIMPALTASSISGERERQTLELMLTTTMEPRDMVLGKLASSLVTMLVLAVSALPVQALGICLRGRYAAGHRDAVPVPRRCGNFNGQYRDLLFIGAAPLDGIDRLLLCDGGGADGGNDGSQSVCIPDGAPGGKFVCI